MKILLAGLLFFGVHSACASIQIMATRIIFEEKNKEQVIRINNVAESPSLVQIWLESEIDNESKGDHNKEEFPFIISPPVSRINAGKGKSFRIFKTEDAKMQFPRDRETLLWVNVLDIPPEVKNDNSMNQLNLAFRTRLKFFYRPVGLPSNPTAGAENVNWVVKKSGGKIEIKGENKSPYHVSIGKFILKKGDKVIDVSGGMINPFSSNNFDFSDVDIGNESIKLSYLYITDLGAFVEKEISLS